MAIKTQAKWTTIVNYVRTQSLEHAPATQLNSIISLLNSISMKIHSEPSRLILVLFPLAHTNCVLFLAFPSMDYSAEASTCQCRASGPPFSLQPPPFPNDCVLAISFPVIIYIFITHTDTQSRLSAAYFPHNFFSCRP